MGLARLSLCLGVPSSRFEPHPRTNNFVAHFAFRFHLSFVAPFQSSAKSRVFPSRLTTKRILSQYTTIITSRLEPRHEQAQREGAGEQRASSLDSIRILGLRQLFLSSFRRRLLTAVICLRASGPLWHLGSKCGGVLQEPVQAGQHNQSKGARGSAGICIVAE